MKALNIDFKKIAAETAGTAAGLVITTQVNRIGFINKIQKPVVKGLVMIALGKIALPKLAGMLMGKGKGNSAAFVDGASAAVTTYGVAKLMGGIDATKNLVPAVSGYEDSVYMGSVYDQNQVVGYEDSAVSEDIGVYD